MFIPKSAKASLLVVEPSVSVKKNSLTMSIAWSVVIPVALTASSTNANASSPFTPNVDKIGVYSTNVSNQS
ncbi:hypothetical protein SDC9_197649 [bioreactor metagenome]|uniref:Uncharacterized protein n=1 Tax=bioreactor metagenome TaxID=1076179 RepID=A0A645INV4_9ZZZZ